MNYQELIKQIADKAMTSQSCTRKVLLATAQVIEENLKANKETYIPKIGKFYPLYRPAMTVKHPVTGKDVVIEHGFKMKFKPAVNLKDAADI